MLITENHSFGAESAEKQLISNRYKPEPAKGPLKAAPENRILTRSCGKTEADDAVPENWEEPATKSAPEAVRIDVEPRTAANQWGQSVY